MKFSAHSRDSVQQKEYKHVHTLRFITIILLGLLAYLVLQTVFFVYKNIYESIASAESIVLLKSELGASVIDFERLHRVAAAWKKKQNAPAPILPHDPFLGAATTTANE